MEATVSEIHAYPLRPEDYAEPLFHSARSRREILEHLAKSNWLFRASQAPRRQPRPATAAFTDQEKVDSRLIASWREVDRWWEPEGGVDVIWRLSETRAGRQELRAEPGCGRAAGRPASAD